MEILAELRTIKWLLIALLGVACFFVYVASKAATRFAAGASNLKENLEYQKFQRDVEGLLQRGSYETAITEAKLRLVAYPSDVYAHYYLGQALFHTDKIHDARSAFQKVAELAPTWQGSVNAWLQRLDDKLSDASPKLVK